MQSNCRTRSALAWFHAFFLSLKPQGLKNSFRIAQDLTKLQQVVDVFAIHNKKCQECYALLLVENVHHLA